MNITRTSVASGITRILNLPVTAEQLIRIERGEHIQNVLPHLSADQREFILTGITGEEWDELFAEPTVMCTHCEWEGVEKDLIAVSIISETQIESREVIKACPNCKTDECLMNLDD